MDRRDAREAARAPEASGDEAPVVRFVNVVLASAVQKGASDIHIEPYEDEVRIRYRIDGVLHHALTPPPAMRDAITSRLKVMARLDIAERRLPQDGRIRIRGGEVGAERDIDLRVSCLPTLFGEKVVLRLLDRAHLALDLERLGFEPAALRRFEASIRRPWGMVLVTGPTGSGKTSTLYSSISRINTVDTNILTAEDPVEFNLGGVNQVPIREGIGLTFSAALRAFLRQDPNVILVGEIRDAETAEIAIKAALTGHLVLSTPAHERRAEHGHPPRQHGSGTLPGRRSGHPHLRAAAGPPCLRGMRRARLHAGRGTGRHRLRRRGGRDGGAAPRAGLRRLQPDGVSRPRGPLRGDGGQRFAAHPDPCGSAGRRVATPGRRGGHADAAAGGNATDRAGDHDGRRGDAGDGPLERESRDPMTMTLVELLARTAERGGSDLHLTPDAPPHMRIDGELRCQADLEPLSEASSRRLVYSLLTDAQRERFEATLELDAGLDVPGVGRVRCNAFGRRGAVAAAYRLVPADIPDLERLDLPAAVAGFARLAQGLVLVTGATGSGKSTTLAALVDRVNRERHGHILTIEDPIEYVHPHRRCLVNQREVRTDTHGFAAALRAALREDPRRGADR